MIELFENNNTSLEFTFPDVHPEIKLAIWFARQLRIPDCVEKCHLPRDIGEFKLRLIDDFPKRVFESWRKRGSVEQRAQAEGLVVIWPPRSICTTGILLRANRCSTLPAMP